MPLVHLSLLRGKPPAYIRAILDGVHSALVETYGVPVADRFQFVHQHEPDEFVYDADYLGVHRTDNVVFVHITAGKWRDTQAKQALYKTIARNLGADPGLRQEDVQVVLSPNDRDDWSFGNGLASYIKDD
ncbi:tautomerase family protein [Mesorhizobium sp. LHD-90]|uniref:tautomerase family protein n=1 Tax=Mesorhizobium sp. LHD-90 TaxID=3071414 RepID=UPI0027E12451|nr:tautomerase family protein [Mesorhizobium sp. LHD-90]MDQ6433447.1 tautomerase family protein [Mesorhizobium sp. LHD-90]